MSTRTARVTPAAGPWDEQLDEPPARRLKFPANPSDVADHHCTKETLKILRLRYLDGRRLHCSAVTELDALWKTLKVELRGVQIGERPALIARYAADMTPLFRPEPDQSQRGD